MKVYIQENWVYVPLGDARYLCIGSKDEVEKSTPLEVSRMIYEAYHTAAYHSITEKHRRTVH